MAHNSYEKQLLDMIQIELEGKSEDAAIVAAVRKVMYSNRTIWYGVNGPYLQRMLFARTKAREQRRKKAEKQQPAMERPVLELT